MGCHSELWSIETESSSRGRCAIAHRGLGPGTAVVDEEALATALLRKESGQRCDYSLRPAAAGRTLSRCKATGLCFCSREDQKAAWQQYYEREFKAASEPSSSSTAPRDLPPQARLALRTLWRFLGEGRSAWQNLQDHWEQIDGCREAQLRGQAAALVEELQKGSAASSGSGGAQAGCGVPADIDDVAHLLAALEVNAMVVTDEEQRSIALGLFITGAAFNHSEDPNCAQSFVGRRLVIRTIRPVALGEELTISYSELAEVSSVRRAKLRAQYYFDPVPKGASGDRYREKVHTRDRQLTEVLQRAEADHAWSQHMLGVQWSLEAGVVDPSNDDADAGSTSAFVRHVHDEWKAGCRLLDGSDDATAAAKQLQKAWKAASSERIRLGDCHALRLQVARDGMDAAIAAERWNDAVLFARAVAAANRKVYPEGWPVTGFSLARLAKLELYHCRFVAAVQAGEEALRILTVACGDSLEAVVELKQMIAQARAEVAAAGHTIPAFIERPALTAPPKEFSSSRPSLDHIQQAAVAGQADGGYNPGFNLEGLD